MDNENNENEIPKHLKIFCLTYNLHGIALDKNQITTLLTKHKNKNFDIYAISTQECQRSIAMNLLYYDKTPFESDLASFFEKDYEHLNTITLGGIHLIIFIKTKYKILITNYYSDYVKTGWYGFLGNKGGIGISFKLFNLYFLFVNCHLSHGKDNCLIRNDEFDYIKKNIHPKIDKIDFIFWMGDLNYRVNKTVEEAEQIYKEGNEMSLLEFEQMSQQIKEYNLKAFGYNEGKINFFPTFKYSDNEIVCDSDEHIPSWTDRILWKVNNEKYEIKDSTKIDDKKSVEIMDNSEDENKILDSDEEIEKNVEKEKESLYFKLVEYNSMQDMIFSDHKPVYAYFELNLE